ncbi:MAG: hypothetical protein IKD06_02955 [Clostridia bacterium]|nr:hypothetical protein [Clostridia bacterium]
MKIKGKKIPAWAVVLLCGVLAIPVVALLLRVETLDLRDAELVYVDTGSQTYCVEEPEQVKELVDLLQGSTGFLLGEGLPKWEETRLILRFYGASVDLTVALPVQGRMAAVSNGLRFWISASADQQLEQWLTGEKE